MPESAQHGRRVLPEALAARAREFVAQSMTPEPAKPSSSVVLLRDGSAGLEVYVHVRHTSMAFAGGMLAFPGGKVDEADAVSAVDDESGWARRLSADAVVARAHVNAALRETTEETGVHLSARDLRPWAHWITPRFERRRYDTWFFLAAQPHGMPPSDVSGEASTVAWISPAAAVDGRVMSDVTMLPPTRSILSDLSGFATVDECLAAADGRRIDTVLPGWVDDGDAVCALLPDDPGYPGDDPGGAA